LEIIGSIAEERGIAGVVQRTFRRREIFEPFTVADAINGPARTTPADGDVQIARCPVDGERGWGETVLADRFAKKLLLGSRRRAGAVQFEKPNAAKRPISEKDSALVAFGKLPVPITYDAGGGAAAERDNGRDDIAEIWRHPPETRALRRQPAVVA